MKINSISFKNVLSYGNNTTSYSFEEIETILISGVNGAGKTTLIDAINFNLTGKPYKNIKLAQFINSKNKKDLVTEGHYISSTGTKVRIIRGRKPDIFRLFINNVEQNKDLSKDFQEKIETVLEFSPKNLEKLFLISSTSYKPFLSSSPEEKRKLIDEIIEIQSFTKMSDLSKKDRTLEKEKLKEIKYQIDKLKSNIELIDEFNKKIDNSKPDNTEEIKEIKLKIEQIKVQAKELKKSKSKFQEKIDNLNEITNELIQKDLKQSKAISDIQTKIYKSESVQSTKKETLSKKSRFFNENESCITCEQEINNDHKEKITWEIETQFMSLEDEDLNIEKLKEKLNNYQAKNDKLKDNININQQMIAYNTSETTRANDEQHQMKYEYQSIHNKLKSLTDDISETIKKKDNSEFIKELNTQYELRIETAKRIDIIEFSIKMLSEKYLRAHQIERYLPELNKSLNKNLEIFGFRFKITLDKEFKETILDKNYSALSYNNFSEGEKKRVDLSLIFAFFDISKLKSKQSSNVLFLDEVADSSLDKEAINGLSHIIDMLTEDKISVILISHNSDVKDSINFTKHIEIVKEGNFSQIKGD